MSIGENKKGKNTIYIKQAQLLCELQIKKKLSVIKKLRLT
jgi:hypothetical protein